MTKRKYFTSIIFSFLLLAFIRLNALPCGEIFMQAYEAATAQYVAQSTYCSTEPYQVACHMENNLQYEQALDNAYDDWADC